jgi:hypothetical protein
MREMVPHMPVAIRLCEPSDVPAMAAIRARGWNTGAFWTSRSGSDLSGEHSPQQALAERTILVAVDSGKIVGFAAGHRSRRLGCDGEPQWANVAIQRPG